MNEKEKEVEAILSAIYLVSSEHAFDIEHFEYLKDKLHKTLTYEQLGKYLQKLRHDKSIIINGHIITWQLFKEYARTKDAASIIASFTNWCVENDLTLEKMLDILAECEKADKEKAKAMEAYYHD